MLVGPYGRVIDGLVSGLLTDVEDHDSSIVATSCDQSGAGRVEVNAHHTRLSGEDVLRPGWVLDSVAANETSALSQEII